MKTVTGNLLDITTGVILHQVNCMGVTGGLAGALRRKWPEAFDLYFSACESPNALGRFVLAAATPVLHVGHVFGQYHPGPNTDMVAVRHSLIEAAGLVLGPIYAPYKMGCGLGGGNWAEYEASLVKAFPGIVIVQRPEDVP